MDLLEKMEMLEECGFIYHECPKCGCDTENVEPDSDKAFCSNCNKQVDVDPII